MLFYILGYILVAVAMAVTFTTLGRKCGMTSEELVVGRFLSTVWGFTLPLFLILGILFMFYIWVSKFWQSLHKFAAYCLGGDK